MVLYKANIKPLGSFASQLQSDTFFGAFCWSYRYLYGEEELVELLHQCMDSEPQIVFSNAYPSGYLPLPIGTYDLDRQRYSMTDKREARNAYQDNKKYKKCSLVKKEAFQQIQKGSRRGYSKFLSKENMELHTVTHNSVSRSSGTVEKSDGAGNLFVANEYFVKQGENFDLYILSALPMQQIEKVLHLMLELGIGADKSTGKGNFTLLSLQEEKELLAVEHANAYMALSNFIPADGDPVDGQYRTMVKHGKLDREYAAGQYPFKKPLLFLQAGAVFKTDAVKEYYGSCMTNIAAMSNVVLNACTIAVPLVIPEKE